MTGNFNKNKLFLAMLLALTPSGLVLAQAETETAAKPVAEEDIEIIEITGFRGSLNVALMAKRDAVGSKEVILAEDLGKFPDLNVADSLARVPGIAIEQDAGEGRQISLRGLGATFVKTTINGMESASAGAATDAAGGSNKSRAFDFNVFASELFTQIDINKTLAAELEDGGISGNVNLQTARPFQYQDTKFAYNVNARYNDVAEEVTPRASLMFSKNWDNKFGVLVSAAYSEGLVQSEGVTTGRWTVNNPAWTAGGADNKLTAAPVTQLSPKGVYTNENMEGLWLPRLPRYSIFNKQQERLGITAAFQYRPIDDLTLNVDFLYAGLDSTMDEFQYSALLRNNVSSRTNIFAENLVVDANNTIVAATLSGVPIRSEARQDVSDSTFKQVTFSGDWHINEKLRMNFLVGMGQSDLDIPYQRTFALDSFNSTFSYSYDSNVDPIALIGQSGTALGQGSLNMNIPAFAFAPSQAFGASYTKAELEQLMLNPDLYSLGLIRNRNQQINSENKNLSLHFAYELSDQYTLKWGVNHRTFSTANVQRDNGWRNINTANNSVSGQVAEVQVQQLDPSLTAGSLYALTLAQAGQSFGNAASVPGNSTLSAGSWLTTNYGKVFDAFNNEAFFEAKERYNSTYDLEERVQGIYLQLDFRMELFDRELRGNIGGRYLDNKNTSGIVNLDHIYRDGYTAGRGAGANFADGYGWRYTVSEGNDFLPSLNLAYDITDDLVGRFSVSKAITRPPLSNLASAIRVTRPSNANNDTATIQLGAGPTLRPYEADQIDLGLEWYFDKEALLAVAFFYKDMTGLSRGTRQEVLTAQQLEQLGIDIGDRDPATVTWDISQLVNTPGESVRGLEFIYQQPFTMLPEPFNRFGLQTNLTLIDYEQDITDPFTLEQVTLMAEETSKRTYNATVYYEYEKFSARFSYNFRERFIKQYLNKYRDEGLFGRGLEDKAQLNFSARYKFSKTMSFSFEAINLTNEANTQWSDLYTPRPYEYLLTGRQYLLGVRGSF